MTDLMPLLQQLSGLSAELIWAAALVFLRVGAMMAVLPAFGDQSVPQRVRLVLTLGFTAVIGPTVWGQVPKSTNFSPAGAEIVAGLALGAGLRLIVLGLQTAGAIIAQGTSLSQLMGGAAPEPQPAVGQLLTMAALALAMTAGLHVRVAEFLILSYELIPPGTWPTAAGLAEWGVGQVGHAFALAFTLAAPFTIAALLYNLALGAINRAMPALMVSFIGAPALAGGGIVMLALFLPLILGGWWQVMSGFLANPALVPP